MGVLKVGVMSFDAYFLLLTFRSFQKCHFPLLTQARLRRRAAMNEGGTPTSAAPTPAQQPGKNSSLKKKKQFILVECK